MRKLKTYSVCIGTRKDDCLFETHEVKAYNKTEAKQKAKCCVPAYWNPIVKDIEEIS